MYKLLKQLSVVASSLDDKGLLKEATLIDDLIDKIAQELTQEEVEQVETLFPADLPQATPEEMLDYKTQQANRTRQEEAIRQVKRKERQLQEFQGLTPKPMAPPSTETYDLDKVKTIVPEEPRVPQIMPLPQNIDPK